MSSDELVVVEQPNKSGCLGLLGNVLWVCFAGIPLAVGFLFSAILCVEFIITIPFAVQCVKMAGFAIWPFGKRVVPDPAAHSSVSAIGNVIWFVVNGWWLALSCVLAGVLLCCTVIGIPFGVQCFKLAKLAWWPFGKMIA